MASLESYMVDELELFLPISLGVERLRKDVRKLKGRVDTVDIDAGNGRLLVEPGKADTMSSAEVTKSRASTGVEYLLRALVIFPDEEPNPPLEDRLPQVQSG
jgi:hypothetical protein